MKVLLSIKPEFANKIFEGTKKFEFRKVIFKKYNVKTVVVYASSPICKVIGEFEIEKIISLNPKEIWHITEKESGITESFFFQYFADRNIAHAIKIKKTKKYPSPLSIKEHFKVIPPQSFIYIK